MNKGTPVTIPLLKEDGVITDVSTANGTPIYKVQTAPGVDWWLFKSNFEVKAEVKVPLNSEFKVGQQVHIIDGSKAGEKGIVIDVITSSCLVQIDQHTSLWVAQKHLQKAVFSPPMTHSDSYMGKRVRIIKGTDMGRSGEVIEVMDVNGDDPLLVIKSDCHEVYTKLYAYLEEVEIISLQKADPLLGKRVRGIQGYFKDQEGIVCKVSEYQKRKTLQVLWNGKKKFVFAASVEEIPHLPALVLPLIKKTYQAHPLVKVEVQLTAIAELNQLDAFLNQHKIVAQFKASTYGSKVIFTACFTPEDFNTVKKYLDGTHIS